jgi:hypothetical protein
LPIAFSSATKVALLGLGLLGIGVAIMMAFVWLAVAYNVNPTFGILLGVIIAFVGLFMFAIEIHWFSRPFRSEGEVSDGNRYDGD